MSCTCACVCAYKTTGTHITYVQTSALYIFTWSPVAATTHCTTYETLSRGSWVNTGCALGGRLTVVQRVHRIITAVAARRYAHFFVMFTVL